MMLSEIKTSSEVHAVLAEILSEYEASYDPYDFDGRKTANKNFGIETAVFLLWLTAVLNHLDTEEVLEKFGKHLIDHPIRESYLNVIGDYGNKWEIDAANLLLVATKDDPRIFDVINDILEREPEK